MSIYYIRLDRVINMYTVKCQAMVNVKFTLCRKSEVGNYITLGQEALIELKRQCPLRQQVGLKSRFSL